MAKVESTSTSTLPVAVTTAVLAMLEVLACYHVAGADDFLIHVGVRGSDHLRDFALAAFTEREEVAHIETRLIFEFRRNVELPARGDAPA